jgi:CheY-like chemotaxis protein
LLSPFVIFFQRTIRQSTQALTRLNRHRNVPRTIGPKFKGKKILLVEDDPDVAHAMAVRLRAKEFTLVMAEDAIGAIGVACKEKSDLIILDLGLPGGDGFAVMQRLKANVDLMLIPVIVVRPATRSSTNAAPSKLAPKPFSRSRSREAEARSLGLAATPPSTTCFVP